MGVVRKVYRSEGLRGFFKGFNLTLMREMPGYFFYFGGYTVSKNWLTNGDPQDKTVWKIATAGGVGGVCLWVVIYPFDLAKTQIQVRPALPQSRQRPARKVTQLTHPCAKSFRR